MRKNFSMFNSNMFVNIGMKFISKIIYLIDKEVFIFIKGNFV